MLSRTEQLQRMIEEGSTLFLPNLSVDIVIFGYRESQLQVLLIEIDENKWMLPGGYIMKEESVDDAARRALKERTGLGEVYLKQFPTFGNPNRSFAREIEQLFGKHQLPWHEDLWINQRFVSTGYYSLVHVPEVDPSAGMFAMNIAWFSLDALPKLLLDHEEIINKAKIEFREDLKASPVAYHLLPEKFTMPELHKVFETVFQKKMDRSRFQKKMFEYNIFQRLNERREGVAHRRPYLYRAR